jgi:hypothetical protein
MPPSPRRTRSLLGLPRGLAAVLAVLALLPLGVLGGAATVWAQSGPPATPTLLAPATDSLGVSATVTLSWSQPAGAVPGTTLYTLTLLDWDTNQTLPPLTTTTTSLAVPTSEALQPGHRYFWTAQACTGSACSATSADWVFFVTPPQGAPGFAVQTGVTPGTTTPTFSWTQPSGATAGSTTYVVAIIDDATGSFFPTLPPTTSLSTTAPPSEGLAYGHTYDWAVTACNGSLCSDFGDWWTWTTAATPGTPLESSPANGATNQSTTPTLSWQVPAGGATSYVVSLFDPYGDPAGHRLGDLTVTPGTPAGNCSASVCSVAVPASEGLLAGQSYSWNVSACTGGSCSGYAGAWWRCSTAAKPLGPPPFPFVPSGWTITQPSPTLVYVTQTTPAPIGPDPVS